MLLVIFVLSNRGPVMLGMWPLPSMQVSLGPIMAGVLALGFILGLLAHIPKHFALRRRARNAEKRVAQLTAAQESARPSI